MAAALRHARSRGLAVTVRGGGHSAAGFAVADEALRSDLTRLSAVAVHAGRRRARVQGGATRRGESYPNFIPAADPARLRASYSPAAWERLRAVRAAWDPEGVFGAGHSIPLP